MGEIPEDVKIAADAVIERGYNEGLCEALARAILAERKRCVDIARGARNDAEFYGNTDAMKAASLIAFRIKEAV